MGKVIVQDFTCKEPITMIGTEAGVCWGADISDQKKTIVGALTALRVNTEELSSSPMPI